MAAGAGGIYLVATTNDDNTDRQQVVAETATADETPTADVAGTPTLDQVNEKRALNGLLTFAPGDVDLSKPNIFPDVEIPTETPGPGPTPQPPSCGRVSGPANGQWLVDTYGEIRTNCVPVGSDWVVTTAGTAEEHGVIAILTCPIDDAECLAGGVPTSDADWRVYSAPHEGGVKVLAEIPPDQLVVNNGGTQLCFSLTSYAYLTGACTQEKRKGIGSGD